jgi:hypothetical protein
MAIARCKIDATACSEIYNLIVEHDVEKLR